MKHKAGHQPALMETELNAVIDIIQPNGTLRKERNEEVSSPKKRTLLQIQFKIHVAFSNELLSPRCTALQLRLSVGRSQGT